MTASPQVSIIMPAYNAGRYIAEAIRSAIEQTFTDWELIVVDDGSTDNTAEVVRRFSDPRIRYIYQENAERAVARNRGLALARGIYIAFLDADDWFLPHKLASQVAVLEQQPEMGAVCSGYHYVDAQGKRISTSRPWLVFPRLDLVTWLIVCPVTIHANLFRRQWLTRIGGFDPIAVPVEDYDLGLRLAYAGCPMTWMEDVVCVYRLHGENTVLQIQRMGQGHRRVVERILNRPDLPAEVCARRLEIEGHLHLEDALRAYSVGNYADGAKHLAKFLSIEQLTPKQMQKLAERIGDVYCNPTWGQSPYVLLDRLFDHLPPEASGLRPWRSWARASAARVRFYNAAKEGKLSAMLVYLGQVLWNAPLSADRGLFATLVKASLCRSRTRAAPPTNLVQ